MLLLQCFKYGPWKILTEFKRWNHGKDNEQAGLWCGWAGVGSAAILCALCVLVVLITRAVSDANKHDAASAKVCFVDEGQEYGKMDLLIWNKNLQYECW